MSSFTPESNDNKPVFKYGSETDIGGGKENQDDFFIFESLFEETPVLILGVLDGHGKELGKDAANASKEFFMNYFAEHYGTMKTAPYECLKNAFIGAHERIKHAFQTKLEKNGFTVKEEENILVKKKYNWAPFSCVHGGSTCSIIAIVGHDLYTANVGDSTALLCSLFPNLSSSMIHSIGDAAKGGSISQPLTTSISTSIPENFVVVTADHSPENKEEFLRLREFRAREFDPSQPELHVVYDDLKREKTRCEPVFKQESDGTFTITEKGTYHKNVRKEFASLVSTPLHSRFADSLAFTRTLGDLNLQPYGVTFLPEIQHIDLRPIQVNNKLCIVLASDGVWDNWEYKDVCEFVMHESCINALSEINGAQNVTKSFMERNDGFAKRNFGGTRDNSTGLIVYIE